MHIYIKTRLLCQRHTQLLNTESYRLGGRELSRRWNAMLECGIAELRVYVIVAVPNQYFLITEISRGRNGVEYTRVSVINNTYLEEMDLVLAPT